MHYKISLQLYHEFQNQQTYNGFCAFERELSEFKNYLQSNQQGNQYNQNRNPIPMNNQTSKEKK